jgi:hypothetical protein
MQWLSDAGEMLKDAMLRYGNVSALAMMQHTKVSIKYIVLILIISISLYFGYKFTAFSRIFPLFSRIFP